MSDREEAEAIASEIWKRDESGAFGSMHEMLLAAIEAGIKRGRDLAIEGPCTRAEAFARGAREERKACARRVGRLSLFLEPKGGQAYLLASAVMEKIRGKVKP
jgi:hypothetical protein